MTSLDDRYDPLTGMLLEWRDLFVAKDKPEVTVRVQFESGMKREFSTAEISPLSAVPDAVAHIETLYQNFPSVPRFNVSLLTTADNNPRVAHTDKIDLDSAPIQYVAHTDDMESALERITDSIGEQISTLFDNGEPLAGARAPLRGLMFAPMSAVVQDDYYAKNINVIVPKAGLGPVVWGKRTTTGEDIGQVCHYATLLYHAARTLRRNSQAWMNVGGNEVRGLLHHISEEFNQRHHDLAHHVISPFRIITTPNWDLPVFAIDNDQKQAASLNVYQPGGVFVMPATDWSSRMVPIAGQYNTLMLLHRMFPLVYQKPRRLSSNWQQE